MADPVLISVETNFTPRFTFNPLSKSDAKGAKNLLFQVLQPSVDLSLPILGQQHYAPAGEPSGFGILILISVLLLAAFGAYKLLK